MDIITQLGQMICEIVEEQERTTLSEVEQVIRQVTRQVGRAATEEWLTKQEEEERLTRWEGVPITYHSSRPAEVITVFGRVNYERNYYLYRDRSGGVYPMDERYGLRPNAMSAEVERLAGLMGVEMAFGRGSEVFKELTLIALSDQSVNKAAQAYGYEVDQWESEITLRLMEQTSRDEPVEVPERVYAALDATSVHLREGEDTPWRHLKVGTWFTTETSPPEHPDDDWRVDTIERELFADICGPDEFGLLFETRGHQHHAQQAAELIVIADGAHWIWEQVEARYPQATQILDWFHAVSYIEPVAQVAFPDVPELRHAWIETVRRALWDGDVEVVIAACRAHIDPNRPDDPARKAVTYYTNHRHRMDYATYRDRGLHIGSGNVESAAKQIGQQRLKVPGAIWNEKSARYIAKARAAHLSDQWLTLARRRAA
jgi:hypothetical protein